MTESPDLAQQNNKLYLFDGRQFDLTTQGNSLHLRLRPTIALEKKATSWILLSVFTALWLVGPFHINRHLPRFMPLAVREYEFPFGLLAILFLFAFGYYWLQLIRNDVSWEFEKSNGIVYSRRNQEMSRRLPYLKAVLAWQRGGKYFIAVQSDGLEPLRLGTFGYATKERAWLDDAEQIAAFLGVPLKFV